MRITPSKNNKNFEFSILSYTSDSPIYIKEGETLSLPGPLSKEIRVIYYPTSAANGSTINVYHPHYPMTVGANFIATDKKSGETLLEENFITNDSPTGMIRIGEQYFEKDANRGVEITISNTGINIDKSSIVYDAVDIKNLIEVQISSGLTRVSDQYPVYHSQNRAGMFDYFLFTKKKGDSAFIYLSVATGEADLYIRKSGPKNDLYPDLDSFDYSSNSVRNDEIMIPPTTTVSKYADQEENFIIGVYSVIASSYTLNTGTVPEFQFLRVTPGQVIKKSINPDMPLLISMMNSDLEPFKVSIMSEMGPVAVFYKVSDESKIYDFQDMIPELSGEKVIHSGASHTITKQKITPNKANTNNKLWTFVIKPEKYDDVTFFIEKDLLPLQVPIGIGFYDILGEGMCQTYEFKYDSAVFDEQLRITAEYGDLKAFISEQNPATAAKNSQVTTYSMKSTGESVIKTIQLSSILAGPDKDINTPDIFDRFYVRVCSILGKSVFKLKTYKPSSRYYRLVPSERLSINLNDDHVRYYYKIDPTIIKSLKLRVYTKSDERNAEYLTDQTQLGNSLAFYYVSNEGFGTKVKDLAYFEDPKNLVQASVSGVQTRGVYATEFSIGVQEGYLLIKPIKIESSKHLVKAQFLVNDYRLLPSSGKVLEVIKPGQQYAFQITKPMNSVTNLQLSACTGEVTVKVIDLEEEKEINRFGVGRQIMAKPKSIYDVQDIIAELAKPVYVGFNSNSSVFIIYISTAKAEGPEAIITLALETKLSESLPALDDYFLMFKSVLPLFMNPVFSIKPHNIDKHHGYMDLSIKPIKPAVGFETRYKGFVQADIEYRLHLFKEFTTETLDAMSNMCSIEGADLRDDTVVVVKTQNIKATNGVLNWSTEPFKFDHIEYPILHKPPIKGVLQIKINFYGDDIMSEDDDSMVLFKHQFTIDEDAATFEPSHAFGIVAVITLVLGAMICALVFWINKNKPVQPDTRGFRQASSENEMHRLQLDSVQEIGRIESTEVEKKDLDETV